MYRLRKRLLRVALASLLFIPTGCDTVEFYQRSAFSDPAMEMGSDPTLLHWHQKVFYSDEGAAGGIGSSAGGGCGCY